jgi:hypothetical protein
MTIKPAERSSSPQQPMSSQELQHPARAIHRLTQMAVNALPQMFDEKEQLFCFKLKRTNSGMAREGISHRYTMMTLMGLHRLEQSGAHPFLEIKSVFDHLVAGLGPSGRAGWVNNTGDLGLLLWTCALLDPDRLTEVASRVDASSALTRFSGGRQGCTMESAWLLTGLSHACLAAPARIADFESLAVETYRRLVRNQGSEGFFGSYARNRSLKGLARGSIGSFADQVYPIYAFTQFAKAFKESNASERALNCARAICNAQGPLGQWWWHYNSDTGNVINQFPVFSVHQHAMGPMALLALGDALRSDFSPWIHKGLNWLTDNELAFDMRDGSSQVIWRCIARPEYRRYINAARNALSKRDVIESHQDLHIVFECRPYELGWLLYAFANANAGLGSICADSSKEALN